MSIPVVDHLVYATPDLDAGIAAIERLLGIRATAGGVHPRWGTRNALVALGPASFLEIIGPDPAQPAPACPRPFGIDTLASPALVTWAAAVSDVDAFAARARQAGVRIGPVIDGRRTRPDGVVLEWRLTDPLTVVADGIVPFAIAWGATPHPALTAAPGATLVALRAEHPDAVNVERMLRGLGIDLAVTPGPRARLVALIEGRRGRVELSRAER